MLKTAKIDFYIDNENQAIPAAIAASYMDLEGVWEEQRSEKVYLPQYSESQPDSPYDWRRIAAVIGITSLGAFALTHQPHLFSMTEASYETETQLVVARSQAKIKSAASSVATPEKAQPSFSNQTKPADSTPSAVANLLQQAQTFSSKAITFSKNARSIDDWSLVASQWQKAVATLAAVPKGHMAYSIAQQKLTEYRPKLQEAQKKANQPIVEAPLPATTVYRPEPKKDPQKPEASQNPNQQPSNASIAQPVSTAALQRPATTAQPDGTVAPSSQSSTTPAN